MASAVLTHQFFAPLIGSAFQIAMDDNTIALRLDAVTPLPPPRRRDSTGEPVPVADLPARQEPFSLLFRGPLDCPLPQRIYRMTVESVPEPLDLFIVPVARESDGFVYQAIFG